LESDRFWGFLEVALECGAGFPFFEKVAADVEFGIARESFFHPAVPPTPAGPGWEK
jgi:hypothetical protein